VLSVALALGWQNKGGETLSLMGSHMDVVMAQAETWVQEPWGLKIFKKAPICLAPPFLGHAFLASPADSTRQTHAGVTLLAVRSCCAGGPRQGAHQGD